MGKYLLLCLGVLTTKISYKMNAMQLGIKVRLSVSFIGTNELVI